MTQEVPPGEPSRGRVSFVGAGPGAADLITLRGARRINDADVVLWSASLVPAECVREHARADAELVDSTRLGREELVEIYRRAERDRLAVARLHSGDPTLWGAVQDQYDACARMHLDVEIVPGVTGVSAAAAAVGRELTSQDAEQPVMVGRMGGGRVAFPAGASPPDFAERGATMALSVSAARIGTLVEELRAGGYGETVAVVIAYKPSSPDELLLHTTLGELQGTVKQHKLWRNTLFLIGPALAGTGRSRRSAASPRRVANGGTSAEPGSAPRRSARAAAGAGGRGRDDGPNRRWRAATVVVDSPETAAPRTAEALASGDGNGSGMPDARRPGQPDSAVAWWAVRDWQRTARGTARIAAARGSSRTVTVDSAQPELFVDHAPGTEPERPPESSAVGVAAADASSPDVVAPGAAHGDVPAEEDTRAREDSAGVPATTTEAAATGDADGAADEPTEQAPSDSGGTGAEQETSDRSRNTGSKPRAKNGQGGGSGTTGGRSSKPKSGAKTKNGTGKSATSAKRTSGPGTNGSSTVA